ncbi:DUF3272 family protein [Streptococcus sp. zg-JUN1979]|uniref:DUF3272 family protein n=1 Tax=Streptococcus sp. zg-JUN1979 TaxID=3391450 RepID=UPI0039A4CE1E
MTLQRFLLMAVLCAFETYCFNEALFEGSYLFAGIWGFLLYRDLRQSYLLSKATDTILTITKKKD